jgi:hypothetical protein
LSARSAARWRRWPSSAAGIVLSLAATRAFAQTAAPTGPSIKVGTTLFANYSYTFAPKTADATGHEVSPSSFDITRAYLTITGDITPRVSFRLTSDVVRETGSGGSLDGSLVLRLKYAYMQLTMTPWLGPHTWVRFGLQNTPITYAIDQIYRYRFQGSPVPERDAGLSSSDAGASLHLDLPGGHGDVHAAVLNGEGYTHAETNNQKAIQVRTSYKPVTSESSLKGVMLQLVVNYDHYAADLPRHRVLASAFYEHRRFNAGLDVLGTRDQPTLASPLMHGGGYSIFVTPFFKTKGAGPEALFRLDRFQLDQPTGPSRTRVVAGIAYWFPHTGPGTAALMLDYEGFSTANVIPEIPTDRRLFVHGLVSF